MQKKPENKKSKTTRKITKAEFEKRVLELAGQGLTSEKIGEALRKENIHPKEHSQKISRILKEHNIYIAPELKNTKEKLEKIKNHVGKNKQDKKAMRERDRTSARLRKIKKYLNIGK